MEGKQWDALLRRIPTKFHEGIILVTTNGTEIIVQGVLKVEEEYLIVRGRSSGTSDAGKIVVIPYDQLNFLSFKKSFTDPEVVSIFGDQGINLAALSQEGNVSDTQEEVGAENSKEEPAPEEVPSQDVSPVPAGPHSKSVLLAKLRARLSGDNGNNFKSK